MNDVLKMYDIGHSPRFFSELFRSKIMSYNVIQNQKCMTFSNPNYA